MTKKAVFLSNLGQLILSYAEEKKGRPMPSVSQKPSFEAQVTAFETIIESQKNPERKKFLEYALSVLVHIQRMPDIEHTWKGSQGTDAKKMIAEFLFFSSNIATSYSTSEFKQIYKSYKKKANNQEESKLLVLHALSFRSSLRKFLLELILKDPTPGLRLDQYQDYVESMMSEGAEAEAKLDSEPIIIPEVRPEVVVSEVIMVESSSSANQAAAELVELKRNLSAKEEEEAQSKQQHAEEIAALTKRAETAEQTQTHLNEELIRLQTLLTSTQQNLELTQLRQGVELARLNAALTESKEGRENMEGLLKAFLTLPRGDKKRQQILAQLKGLLLAKNPEATETKETPVKDQVELEGEPSSSSEENLLKTSVAQLRHAGSFGSGNRAPVTAKSNTDSLSQSP